VAIDSRGATASAKKPTRLNRRAAEAAGWGEGIVCNAMNTLKSQPETFL